MIKSSEALRVAKFIETEQNGGCQGLWGGENEVCV